MLTYIHTYSHTYIHAHIVHTYIYFYDMDNFVFIINNKKEKLMIRRRDRGEERVSVSVSLCFFCVY